jgi:Ca2+-binding RTX toxin-like protein
MTMAIVIGTNNSDWIDPLDGVTNGDDLIYGFGGNDTIFALNGYNTVYGGDGNDDIFGGDGYDDLYGEDGDDDLYGGADIDYLFGGEGADHLDGGDDYDYAAYSDSSAGVIVDLETGLALGGDAQGDTLTSIEGLIGSEHDDTFIGDDNANWFAGEDGDDTLKGGGGSDALYGDSPIVRLPYDPGPGYNNLLAVGDDTLIGGGGGGGDYLDGGEGNDTAAYDDSPAGVTVSLIGNTAAGGHAAGDTLVSIENLTGSGFADWLEGDNTVNVLRGSDGDDTLEGRGGADMLNGGAGSDTASYYHSSAGVFVSLLADTAAGGDAAGDDLNSIEHLVGSAHADVLSGNNNGNVIDGVDGDNWLYGYGGADGLAGGDDTDMLFGMEGADFLKGAGGNDTLVGGSGGDTMLGGSGDDTYFVEDFADVVTEYAGEGAFDRVRTSVTYSLAAGSEVEVLEAAIPAGTAALDLVGNEFDNFLTGNDGINVLVGGLGIDTLRGNGGGDAFLWSSVDEIGLNNFDPEIVADYSSAEGDVLHFTNIDADETLADDQDFTFRGAEAFTAAGQINWFSNGTDAIIQLNTNADLAADAIILLSGVPTGDSVLMFL